MRPYCVTLGLLMGILLANAPLLAIADSAATEATLESPGVFFERLLEPTLGGLLALIDPASGLPYDVGTIGADGIAVKDAKTSPTNIGLLMTGLVAVRDLGLASLPVVEARLLQIVSTLEGIETWEGFFYNWYDLAGHTEDGLPPVGAPSVDESARRFVSSVDNANLTASMMVAAGAFPGTELGSRLESLIAAQDYAVFFRDAAPTPDKTRPRISHGYNVSRSESSPYDYGTFMTEARLLVFLALAMDQVPAHHWMSAGPDSTGYMEAQPVACSMSGSPIVAIGSWGGSLFEEIFPDLFLDEKCRVENLAENHRRAVQVHMARANMDTGLWGWSPAQSADCSYTEAGVACLGLGGGYPLGDVSAYSLCLAARYAPAEAAAALANMRLLLPGSFDARFGYCDSVSQDGTRYCADVLALDKGMELLGIAAIVCDLADEPTVSRHLWNYLDDHRAGETGRELLRSVQFASRWDNAEPTCECADEGLRTNTFALFGSAGQGGGGRGSMNGVVDGFEWAHPIPTTLDYDVGAATSFAYFTVLSVDAAANRKPVSVRDYNALRVEYDESGETPCQFRIELKSDGTIMQSFIIDAVPEDGSEAVVRFNGMALDHLDEITIAIDHRLATSCDDGRAAGTFRIEEIELLCLPVDG